MKKMKHISLDDIGNRNPFRVPDNYFEQFAVQMDGRFGYATVTSKRIVRSWIYYAAAALVGVVFLSQMFYVAHQRNLAKNAENYEMYVMSQVDESTAMDYYLTDAEKK